MGQRKVQPVGRQIAYTSDQYRAKKTLCYLVKSIEGIWEGTCLFGKALDYCKLPL